MYRITMKNGSVEMSRDTLMATIPIPRDMLRALITLAIGSTIHISGWEITRI